MEGVTGGGGLLCRRRPVFSDDGKHLFVLSGRNVHVYNTSTGQLVSCLKGHDAEVTSICLDPQQPGQVYTASRDCSIRKWNAARGTLLRRHDLFQLDHNMMMPAEHMVVTAAGDIFLSINWYINPGSGRIARFDWKKGIGGSPMIAKPTAPGPPLLCSPSTNYAAFFVAHTISVFDTRLREPKVANFVHTRNYSAVAMDSADRILAAGDISGRIMLWHNFGQDVAAAAGGVDGGASRPLRRPDSTLHWHAHPVAALTFSPDSTVMLSGGKEATLVLWPLEAGNSRPNFLPRLGAPLEHITGCTTDPAVFAVSQWDNSVRLVNLAAMRVTLTIAGLRTPPSVWAARQLLALEPRSGYIVLAASNNMLQFYDAAHNRPAYRLQVAPRNFTDHQSGGAEWAVQPPMEPHVSHVAFSRDGSGMATVDSRPDAGAEFGMSGQVPGLKFWDQTSEVQGDGAAPYTLNTRVDDAHREAVTGLAYHPTRHMVATCSSDTDFKLWARAPVAKGTPGAAPGATCWRCHAVGSYQQLPLHACAFSPDGSLLAVAAPHLVTLWVPDSCSLLGVLHGCEPHLAPLGIQQLAFIPGTPYLVGSCGLPLPAGPQQPGVPPPEYPIMAWNLLTASLEWSLQLPITFSAIVPCPTSGQFGVLVPAQVLFPPGTEQQLQQQRRPHPPQQQQPAGQEGQAPVAKKGRSTAMRPQYHDKRHGLLLVFDPSSCQPRTVYTLPPGRGEHAVCIPPASPLHPVAAAAGSGLGMSPMLVVNDSCCYYYAASKGEASGYKAGNKLHSATTPSPLEAAFGKRGTPSVAGALPAAPGGGTSDWQHLFDAPSHMLPPAQQLCLAFLDTLVT